MANITVSTKTNALLSAVTDQQSKDALISLGAVVPSTTPIAASDIATNAVTTIKIADANVTTDKILDANVTAGKLASGAAEFNITLLPVAKGGTGTATPGLVQGSNVTITGTWPNQAIAATSSAPTNETVNTAINTDPAETRYALSVERKQNLGAAIQSIRGASSKNLRVVTFGDSLVAQGTPLNLSGVIPSAGGSCEAEGSINVAGTTTIEPDWTNPGGRYANIPALGTRRFARYSPSASAAPFHHASIFKVYYVKNTGTFKLRSATGLGKTISIAPTIAGTTETVNTGYLAPNQIDLYTAPNGTDYYLQP